MSVNKKQYPVIFLQNITLTFCVFLAHAITDIKYKKMSSIFVLKLQFW